MAYNKSDTNVDTCCLGINLCILGYTTRTADVFVYELHIKPVVTIPIVTGTTAVSAVIIIFNESLYYVEKPDHSLINPNQVYHYGLDYLASPYDEDIGLKWSVGIE